MYLALSKEDVMNKYYLPKAPSLKIYDGHYFSLHVRFASCWIHFEFLNGKRDFLLQITKS